jgi:Na+-transporting NADH:ubiquinone oxidoreductase subunit NqrC
MEGRGDQPVIPSRPSGIGVSESVIVVVTLVCCIVSGLVRVLTPTERQTARRDKGNTKRFMLW